MRKNITYVGIFELCEDGTVCVFFPDLPGCVSAGDTPESAVTAAEKALTMHIKSMVYDGEMLPNARASKDIPHEEGVKEISRMTFKVTVFLKVERGDAE